MTRQANYGTFQAYDELQVFHLPKMAAVMWIICCFKPASSSVTGLSWASMSSARFNKAAFSVSQAVHSEANLALNSSFSFKENLNFDSAFRVSASWCLIFLFNSPDSDSWWLKTSYNKVLKAWIQVNTVAIHGEIIIQVPATLQAICLALGG